jgi:hypothetical protein
MNTDFMNATLFEGGKVHRLAGSAARCGVGKGRQRCAWQMDLSGVTCLRCAKSLRAASTIEQPSNEGPSGRPPMNADEHERKDMHKQPGLNSKQKRIVNKIGQRMAQAQAVYLKTERECLTEFTQAVGYDSPDDARQYVMELLLQDEAAGQMTYFADEEDWPRALTRIALRQLEAMANEKITEALERVAK